MRPYQPLPQRQPFLQSVLKDETLVAEEKEIGGRQIPYILRGKMLMTSR